MQRVLLRTTARSVSRSSNLFDKNIIRGRFKRFNSSHSSNSRKIDPTIILLPIAILGGLYACFDHRIELTSKRPVETPAPVAAPVAEPETIVETPEPVEEPVEEAAPVPEETSEVPEPTSEAEEVATPEPTTESASTSEDTPSESAPETLAQTEENEQAAAYNPETGEINWDCPCLGGMANGPCGEEFKAAFSCFVYSEAEPKGIDCIEKFKGMQECFRKYPEVYAEELRDDEVPIGDESSTPSSEPVSETPATPDTEETSSSEPVAEPTPLETESAEN